MSRYADNYLWLTEIKHLCTVDRASVQTNAGMVDAYILARIIIRVKI